ncbi:MAG: DUF434 domain-containing protein [Pseudoramibacter sp.]|jgi:hypothetical protein
MANAKRGFVPEDLRNFSKSALPILRSASSDVCHLLDRGYSLDTTLTFVGNHYQLSVRQRLAIMRSVCSSEQQTKRLRKMLSSDALDGQTVWIDGFNQIITLEVMACRSPLFLGMDGAVRDLAALRGTYRLIPETDWAVRTLLRFLKSAEVGAAVILLDAPVSNSGRLRQAIFKANAAFGLDLAVPLIRGVDAELSGHAAVMTADSAVLDRCAGWINFTGSLAQSQHIPLIQVWP